MIATAAVLLCAARATTLSDAPKAADAPPPPDQLDWVLSQLRSLPPLDKPHVSRPACWYMGGALSPNQHEMLREYARVLRALPLCGYSHEADGQCAEANIIKQVNATFTTMISPWYGGFWNDSLPPTFTGAAEQQELNATKQTLIGLSRYLSECNATGMLASVLIDNERFWVRGQSDPQHEAWNSAVDRKNNLVYTMVKSYFPNARIEWFGRGAVRRSENDQGAGGSLSGTSGGTDGWIDCPYFSLREHGDSFGVSLYTVPEIGYTREAFNRTVQRAISSGEPCTRQPCSVTPWLALGVGFQRGAPYKLEGRYLYPSPYRWNPSWNYPSIYSWQLGAEVNGGPGGNAMWTGISWDRATYVALFPTPLIPTDQGFVWANGTNSSKVQVAYRHLISYLRGAAGLDPLVDEEC